jgi:hypothetical protein
MPLCELYLAKVSYTKPLGKVKMASYPLELAHSYICGPMNIRACHDTYFLTFIYDYSCYGVVYMLSHRWESLDYLKWFFIEVENQKEKNLKVLHTDISWDYLSK